MRTETSLKTAVVVTSFLAIAFVALYFISPIVEALNTHSIDIESGSSQSLSISDGSQTGLDLSDTLTLESWVKFETVDGDHHFIAKRNPSGSQRSYDWRFSGGNTYILQSFTDGSTTGCNVNVTWTPSTDVWYHLAVTKNGTAVKFYVNGVQQGSEQTCSNATIYNGTAKVDIGANSDDGEYFDGKLDDVRIWNVARTGVQIADDLNDELNGNESGLVGYWKLNNSLSDSTANDNTLTNNNSATFSSDTHAPIFTEDLSNRKASNESVTSSTVVQNDDQLVLGLSANKTYIIDGVIFASSTSATPDIIIAFAAQSGAIVRVGYTNDVNEMVLDSGEESSRVNLPANTPTSIHIKGTVVTSSTSGDFQLKWAQATSNAAATTVMTGSYLRAEEI